jgi:hypothetical protein
MFSKNTLECGWRFWGWADVFGAVKMASPIAADTGPLDIFFFLTCQACFLSTMDTNQAIIMDSQGVSNRKIEYNHFKFQHKRVCTLSFPFFPIIIMLVSKS